jgi:acetyltransferase-like isoleucine patch superfamily enzyme
MTLESLAFRAYYGLGSRFRIAFYKFFGMKIGAQCRLERIRARRPAQIEVGPHNSITEGCWLWPADAEYKGIRIRIGEQNYFNRDCMFDACGYIQIGDRNMFGPRVYVTDSNHRVGDGGRVMGSGMLKGRVEIGNDCWIGANAVILKDVVLGDGCIVAAGAVVTKSFPANSVVAGVPAKLLRQAHTEAAGAAQS